MWMESEGHKWFHFMWRAEAAIRDQAESGPRTWSAVGAGHVWSTSGEMCVVMSGGCYHHHHGDTFHYPVPWTENHVPAFVNIAPSPGRLYLVWHHDHEPPMLVSVYKVLQCSQHIISFMAHGETGRGIIVCCKASNLTSCFVSQLHSLARHLIDQWSAECRIVSLLSPGLAGEKLEWNLICRQMLLSLKCF